MTATIARKRIRLVADQATRTSDKMVDVYTSATPELWRGNDVQFEIGIFHDGSIALDITNIASLTLEVKADDARTGTALMTATLAAGDLDTITQANWDNKTAQNALIVFTGAETNLVVGEDNTESFWLVISMITNDAPGHKVTLQSSILTIVEDGTGSAGSPPNNVDNYYTKGDADARFVQKHADAATWQFYNGCWYCYESDTDKWYPHIVEIVDSVPVSAWGEGVTL